MSDVRVIPDVFRPRDDPARLIYDTFQDESINSESMAVWQAACDYSKANVLQVPTFAQVERAQQYAQGSVDYGVSVGLCLSTS